MSLATDLGIKIIVYIDDLFAEAPTANLYSTTDALAQAAEAKFAGTETAGDLSSRHEYAASLADSFVGLLLEQAGTLAVVLLSPSEWDDCQGAVLDLAEKGESMVLVDLDLGRGDKKEGVKIVGRVATKAPQSPCMLVTQSPQVEKLAEDGQSPYDALPDVDPEVVLFPKSLVPTIAATDPATVLSTLVVSAAAGAAVRGAAKQLKKGVKHAAAKILGLSPTELIGFIAGTAQTEGHDYRLSAIIALQELARSYGTSATLASRPYLQLTDAGWQSTQVLKKAAQEDADSIAGALGLQHMIYYEGENSLNGRYAPITLGDIFTTADATFHILLAQPCDLALRSDGKRAIEKDNPLWSPTLAAVEPIKASRSPREFALDYWIHAKERGPWRVHFAKTARVPALVLDTAAFHAAGRCGWPVEDVAGLHEVGPIDTKRRYEYLCSQSVLPDLIGAENSRPLKISANHLWPNEHELARLGSGSIASSLSRVGRLHHEVAYQMLHSFANWLGRHPLSVNLAREVAPGPLPAVPAAIE